MPRTARASKGGICYHVINRGNARATVFHNVVDYRSFLGLVARAQARVSMDILAICLMPNHFHFVVRPVADGDLGRWMQWLMTTHVRRHHHRHGTSGRVWQGRFKAFPIQQDGHLLAVMRYVERNALRASLVTRAEHWTWGSLCWRSSGQSPIILTDPPVDLPRDWLVRVNNPEDPQEVHALRHSVNKGTPYGNPQWIMQTVKQLGLEHTLRQSGRPRKHAEI